MYVLSKIKINVLVIFAVMVCHDLITLSNINDCTVARKIYCILPFILDISMYIINGTNMC